MLKLIEDYEPRAEKPVLTFLGADSTLYAAFQLQCEVEGSPAAFLIRMHTILRYVTVEPMAPGPDGRKGARVNDRLAATLTLTCGGTAHTIQGGNVRGFSLRLTPWAPKERWSSSSRTTRHEAASTRTTCSPTSRSPISPR